MNKKLQPTVLALALAASFGAQAATVYKIENIDEFYKVNGTIKNSRSGFGVTLNNSGDILGGASGLFAPNLSEQDQDTLNNNTNSVLLNEQATSSLQHPYFYSRRVKDIPQATNTIFQFSNALEPEKIQVFPESLGEDAFTIEAFAFDVSNTGLIVGVTSSAAKEMEDPDQRESNSDRDEKFYVYDFLQRAMVIDNGDVKTFAPEFSDYGGQSGLMAINDSNLVVGYASTGLEPDEKSRIETDCVGDNARYEDIRLTVDPTDSDGKVLTKNPKPLQVCAFGFVDGSDSSVVDIISHSSVRSTSVGALFYLQAYSWEYQNGELINAKPLGILTTPISDTDSFSYNSIAVDVNNNGIAVGRSTTFRDGEKKGSSRLQVATVYKDGKVIDLMDHSKNDWRYSSANAINDNNLVVGFMEKSISGFTRKKFFVYDADSEDTTLTFPNDFATKQTDFASNAKSINNKNQVVGSIEVDSQKITQGRRTHGFLYNHNEKSFTDINNMLTCESKGYVKVGSEWKKYQVEATGGNEQKISYDTDISIVDASKIADDGTIIATALVTLPRVQTRWVDDKGNEVLPSAEGAKEELVVDSKGSPVYVTNAKGEPITEQVPRAVILKPAEGEACSLEDDAITEYIQERQGAGFGIGALMLATAGLFIRRFRR